MTETRCKYRLVVRKGVYHCMAVELPPYLRRVSAEECRLCRHLVRINEANAKRRKARDEMEETSAV